MNEPAIDHTLTDDSSVILTDEEAILLAKLLERCDGALVSKRRILDQPGGFKLTDYVGSESTQTQGIEKIILPHKQVWVTYLV